VPSRDKPSFAWVGLIAGPVAGLATFVITYFIDPLNFGGHNALAAIPAILLAVVVLLIGQNVAAYRELERAANQTREIYEAVKDYLHVTKVGSPERGMRYIASRLPILQEVRNTSFNLRDQTDRADDMFYDTDLYRELSTAIAHWSCKGLRWKDIGDSLAVDRFRSIYRAAHSSGHESTSRYQYRLIKHNEPQLNFIILGYEDGTSEVLFNWDFRNFGQDPIVLLSRDRDIVQMFTVQFEQLWKRASPDHDTYDLEAT
jgi:hypothetical protein